MFHFPWLILVVVILWIIYEVIKSLIKLLTAPFKDMEDELQTIENTAEPNVDFAGIPLLSWILLVILFLLVTLGGN